MKSKQQLPTTMFGNPNTFTAAANTQASDYDKIMAQYADIARSSINNPISFNSIDTPSPINSNPLTPQLSQYSQSADVTKSLAGLKGLLDTGGYSDADKADIRARDISPIRSIYANAQQNTERARALGGGYSPNFNAVTASMARDAASKIGDVTTAANAGIAQNVAANKVSTAPAYASASATANAAKTAADKANTDIINEINRINEQNRLGTSEFNVNAINRANEFNSLGQQRTNEFNRSNALGATQGMTSLYGTTPALTNLFGNQVVSAANLGQNQQQINNQRWNAIGNLNRFS